MTHRMQMIFGAVIMLVLAPGPARSEILAMMNYESKTAESIKTLKISGPQEREEGIAIMDVDPNSENFGTVLMTIPLPSDLIAHHIFYNRDMSKAYLTALGKPLLHVIDMNRFPYRLKRIEVPDCRVGEDVIFSGDNKTWYLTCMGSNAVIVGDAVVDKPIRTIATPMPYPHGIAIHDGIDRILVSSTVRASDLGDPGETITVLKASTGDVLSSHKVSNKPSPSGEAPVEILFVPGSNPPTAYITNMYGGTVWAAVWNAAAEDFDVEQVIDFAPLGVGVPLELYVDGKRDRLYITTAKPGRLHIFDIGAGPTKPKLVKTLATGEGAHHVAFTRDGRYAFVQNALLNLPGMSDGSITVIDLAKDDVIGSIDTLKNGGFNPNLIVLLPEWNDPAGH
ncbi:MAG: YncE family protein [Alphaproteobacteria bacterium]